MKTIITYIIAFAALTATASATSYAPRENHTVKSTNGKFELHVVNENTTQRVTGAFSSGLPGWSFQHLAGYSNFFVSDDGEAAAVMPWAHVQQYRLNEPAIVIYGRHGAKQTYTFAEISKPTKLAPGEIGYAGDYWRIWGLDATIQGSLLTVTVEGGENRVIDLNNPQPLEPPNPTPFHVDLPAADDVKSLSIKFSRHEEKDTVEFRGNADDWAKIRAQLMPAQPSPECAVWKSFAILEIIRKDGSPYHLELFHTIDTLGAFTAGPTREEGKHFRGGDTGGQIDALSAAYQKAKKPGN